MLVDDGVVLQDLLIDNLLFGSPAPNETLRRPPSNAS